MSSRTSATASAAHVTPIRTLRRTLLLPGACSLLPVAVAVLWLTHDSTAWPVVAGCEFLAVLVFATAYLRFRRAFTAVTPTQLAQRGLLRATAVIDRQRIDHLLIHRVYRIGSTDALVQLIGVDPRGQRLFGMNSLFWADDDIQRIAEALEIPTTIHPMPLSRGDYHRKVPAARPWYAGRGITLPENPR